MQIKQSILAFFFLALYSLGFGHGVVPHCDNRDDQIENHHHHEHHEHNNEEPVDDGHVVHDDHFDEGIYDYIICLVSDLEHNDSDCNMHHCTKVNLRDTSIKQSSKAKLLAVVSVLFNVEIFVKPTMVYGETASACISPPFLKNVSHRGPPIISC